jgi:LysM repeat protein
MFIRAVYYRDKKTVHYFDENNEETLYIGGSFAWRMNNPGNLAKPGRRVIAGIIGYAQRTSDPHSIFCIFGNREAGEKARISLLKEVYGKSTIAATMAKYAPKSDGNDTEGYINYLCENAKVPRSTVINDMTPAQFDAMVKAMEVKEGNFPGKIVKLGKRKSVELRDMVQQPIPKKEVHLTSGDDVVKLKTDVNGTLPDLYPDLFMADLNFHFGDPAIGIGTEKIGTVSSGMFKNNLTFVAPYYFLTSNARPHETKVVEEPLVHIVRSGETLTGIASKYGMARDDLASANNITDVNKIFDRQHLKIPGKSAALSAGPGATPAPAAAPTPAHAAVPPPPPAKPPPAPAHVQAAKPAPPAPAPKPSPLPAKVPAPAAKVSVDQQRTDKKHPVTVLSSPTLTPSGAAWCNRFLGSNSLDSLNAEFKPKAKAFIAALKAQGITVKVSAAYRPVERSYLMYNAFQIARGMDATKAKTWPGVPIDWAHRSADGTPDPVAAKRAAEAMCAGYGIHPHSAQQKVGKPAFSNHNKRAAIDMNVSGYIGKTVKNKTGDDIKLTKFTDLVSVGLTYGVIYYNQEKMHWSTDGH